MKSDGGGRIPANDLQVKFLTLASYKLKKVAISGYTQS